MALQLTMYTRRFMECDSTTMPGRQARDSLAGRSCARTSHALPAAPLNPHAAMLHHGTVALTCLTLCELDEAHTRRLD